MSRSVIVASSAGRARKIENFSGTTAGDLRNHPDISPIWVSGEVDAVLPGNLILRNDDSVLPEGDIRVYLIARKNVAGLSEESAENLGEQIAEAIVKAAALADQKELDDLKESLIAEIEEFFGVDLDENNDDNDENCEECDDAIEEAKQLERNR